MHAFTVGSLVETPAFVIRRGIDADGRSWRIRARVLARRPRDPRGMVRLRAVDREFATLPNGRGSIFRLPADLSAA